MIIKVLSKIFKRASYTIGYYIYYLINWNSLFITWDNQLNNFGDIITPFILKNITNKKIKHIKYPKYFNKKHFLIIGSILQNSTKNSIIWGSGFISNDSKCYQKPKDIFAVRGPLTREKLIKEGIQCPEIFGDPALLLPKFYSPKYFKKYKIGIIPHYVDKNNSWLIQFDNNPNYCIIDVQQDEPLKFIDKILMCEKIISSSLHGLIVSDAYGIPSLWVEFSKNVYGDGFKFLDYFKSVNRKDVNAIFITNSIYMEDLIRNFYEYKIEIDLDKLLENSPFK